jgi:hypothetical protein
LLGPDAQHATDPVSFGWGICIYITVFNTVLCVLFGTIVGLIIKVVKRKPQQDRGVLKISKI